MVEVAFYGDDFTGSTDAMVQFARVGLRTVLLVKLPSASELAELARRYDVIGVAGVARALAPDEQEAEVRPILQALHDLGPRLVQYKVCSTADSSPTRGSIGRALEIGRDICAPAVPVPILIAQPELGRYTVFSHHFATESGTTHRLDRQPTMSTHPTTPIHESDLRLHLSTQTTLTIGAHHLTDSPTDAQVGVETPAGAEVGMETPARAGVDAHADAALDVHPAATAAAQDSADAEAQHAASVGAQHGATTDTGPCADAKTPAGTELDTHAAGTPASTGVDARGAASTGVDAPGAADAWVDTRAGDAGVGAPAEARTGGPGVPDAVVLDALTEADVRGHGAAILRSSFAVGSGGLSRAVGVALRPEGTGDVGAARGGVGPVLVVVGSRSRRTAAQVEEARDSGWVVLPLGDGVGRRVVGAFEVGVEGVVVHTGELTAGELSDLPARLAGVVRDVSAATVVRRLVVAGGDTSGQVLRELDVAALEYVRTVAPGVHLCRADSPYFDEVLLKPGQLGPVDLFTTFGSLRPEREDCR
ncbi:four-carbon acid sugar kinase family protein [Kribbella sp. GL6]|uniref:four-carbon acid sugar kinase family protein n=1 Tax=Kribbella sp. GL6 TaxID=3419765 RepID=UPI003CFFCB1B